MSKFSRFCIPGIWYVDEQWALLSPRSFDFSWVLLIWFLFRACSLLQQWPQNIIMEIWRDINNFAESRKTLWALWRSKKMFGVIDDDLTWSQMDPEFQTKLKVLPPWVLQWVTLVPWRAVGCRTEELSVYREIVGVQPREELLKSERNSSAQKGDVYAVTFLKKLTLKYANKTILFENIMLIGWFEYLCLARHFSF